MRLDWTWLIFILLMLAGLGFTVGLLIRGAWEAAT